MAGFLKIVNEVLLPLYYIGGIIVAIAAWRALKQVVVMREQLGLAHDQFKHAQEQIALYREESRIRSKREAAHEAAILCDRFANNVIPLSLRLQQLMDKYGYNIYEGEVSGYDRSAVSEQTRRWMKQWFEFHERAKNEESYVFVGVLLNELEAISLYFAEGIASEEIAYPSIGHVFCQFVKAYYPYLLEVTIRGDKFEYVKRLNDRWSARIKSEQLMVTKTQIDDELRSLDTSSIPVISL